MWACVVIDFVGKVWQSTLWACVEIDFVSMYGNLLCGHVWKSTLWACLKIDFVGMFENRLCGYVWNRLYGHVWKSTLWACVEIDFVGMCGNRYCGHKWKSCGICVEENNLWAYVQIDSSHVSVVVVTLFLIKQPRPLVVWPQWGGEPIIYRKSGGELEKVAPSVSLPIYPYHLFVRPSVCLKTFWATTL